MFVNITMVKDTHLLTNRCFTKGEKKSNKWSPVLKHQRAELCEQHCEEQTLELCGSNLQLLKILWKLQRTLTSCFVYLHLHPVKEHTHTLTHTRTFTHFTIEISIVLCCGSITYQWHTATLYINPFGRNQSKSRSDKFLRRPQYINISVIWTSPLPLSLFLSHTHIVYVTRIEQSITTRQKK